MVRPCHLMKYFQFQDTMDTSYKIEVRSLKNNYNGFFLSRILPMLGNIKHMYIYIYIYIYIVIYLLLFIYYSNSILYTTCCYLMNFVCE